MDVKGQVREVIVYINSNTRSQCIRLAYVPAFWVAYTICACLRVDCRHSDSTTTERRRLIGAVTFCIILKYGPIVSVSGPHWTHYPGRR